MEVLVSNEQCLVIQNAVLNDGDNDHFVEATTHLSFALIAYFKENILYVICKVLCFVNLLKY